MKVSWRVALSLVVLSASPAFAIDHFARVNEVLLSVGGDTTKQVLEIEDLANETFAGAGYTLFIYEANGVDQAHFQTIVLNPGVMRMTFASSSALTHFSLATSNTPPHIIVNLGGDLPAAGTACFRKQGVDLHCMSWGLVTLPAMTPTNGRLGGPAPTDGMSLQRQATGNCAGIGAPTVNAVNATLACMDPPMSGTDGGMIVDGGMMGTDGGTMPKPEDDGCSAGGGTGWFGTLATLSLFGYARARRTRRRAA